MSSIRSIIEDLLSESGKPMLDGLGSGLRLREDLGLDSMELAILTVRIEAVYQVDVFERGLATTVGEVAERIRERHPGVGIEELIG
jgi:acyl carrier protein